MIDDVGGDRQFAHRVRQIVQRLFQQVAAVIGQAEIVLCGVVRDGDGRHRTFRVKTLLPQ
ncbi:hypothetical protein SDC9_211841 [bioreactor metagenome]|uniref:Uncharacterized protein n=1 Tax=bioreactor metagenome TaxID=1076179 RepID=A0A645JLU2_9ZZZZ